MTDEVLKRTPLCDFHKARGARMVPFAGYEMPVQYTSIIAEHNHTRTKAGLFDVSHMGVVRIEGAGAEKALEAITPIDMQALPVGKQKYSYFTNDEGGILDDIMVFKYDGFIIVVVNAGCKEQDVKILVDNVGKAAKVNYLADYALLALQGPEARAVFSAIVPEVADMGFMTVRQMNILGAVSYVSCSGYTGEDGFEIAIPAAKVQELTEKLLADERVMLIGLGARDTLRLEAGLCLYGHDIDVTRTPVEANIQWAISKRRREEKGFPGAEIIVGQIAGGVDVKLVGILPEGKAPVRAESAIMADGGTNPIGVVTSGTFSPTLGAPIAIGYVDAAFAAEGSVLGLESHGKIVAAKVVKLPFVPHHYVK